MHICVARPQWVKSHNASWYLTFFFHILTHCGLVMQYDDIDLGQHWLRYWLGARWHHAITWTNVDLTSIRSNDIHLRAILQESPQSSITKISLKNYHLKFHSNPPGSEWVKLQEIIIYDVIMNSWCSYRQISNISCTLIGNKIVDHSDVVGASPVGTAPTTSSFST